MEDEVTFNVSEHLYQKLVEWQQETEQVEKEQERIEALLNEKPLETLKGSLERCYQVLSD